MAVVALLVVALVVALAAVVAPLVAVLVAVVAPLVAVANRSTLRALVFRLVVVSKNRESVSLNCKPTEDRQNRIFSLFVNPFRL